MAYVFCVCLAGEWKEFNSIVDKDKCKIDDLSISEWCEIRYNNFYSLNIIKIDYENCRYFVTPSAVQIYFSN